MSEQYKPLPDWSEIDPKYKWRAVDDNGELYYYKKKPCLFAGFWNSSGESVLWSEGHDQTNWRESLQARPEKTTPEDLQT